MQMMKCLESVEIGLLDMGFEKGKKQDLTLISFKVKVFFLVTTLFFSNMAFGCMFPITGEKYNALIKIEKLEKPNHYRIEVPKRVENMSGDTVITLVYDLPNLKTIAVETIIQGDKMIGEFVVQKEDVRPFIRVMWWPGQASLCGISANTGSLDVEEIPWWRFW